MRAFFNSIILFAFLLLFATAGAGYMLKDNHDMRQELTGLQQVNEQLTTENATLRSQNGVKDNQIASLQEELEAERMAQPTAMLAVAEPETPSAETETESTYLQPYVDHPQLIALTTGGLVVIAGLVVASYTLFFRPKPGSNGQSAQPPLNLSASSDVWIRMTKDEARTYARWHQKKDESDSAE